MPSFRMGMSPAMSLPPSSPSVVAPSPPSSIDLPVRPVPGSYGWPLLGPFSDRLDYFWFQKPEAFFRKRIEKYKSTVFRTNVPPSFPFFTNVNPSVVALLDCKSFAHLFDVDLIDKKNVLIGDFMPSVAFTGNMRVGVYQDTSEPQHPKVKKFIMDVLKRSSGIWATELASNLDVMWDDIESTVSKSSSAGYIFPLQRCLFAFLCKVLAGADASCDPDIAKSGHAMLDRWLALQILPTVPIGVLQPLEEIFLHSFAYPFFLVSGDYNKLYQFIKKEGKEVITRGETEFGLSQDEVIHNLLFVLGFNAFGGFSVFLPGLIDTIASDETGLEEKLRTEAREKGGPTLSLDSVKEMHLIQSVVYETLRLNPPVPLQYGRARKDFRLCSHDSAFEIKKGELLCGYQKLVMRDPVVFDDPESFRPDRFTGGGVQLLDYLYWSNGPQSGSPSESNKQCAGKDVVTLTASFIVAHMFRRYDSIKGNATSITAVQKAK
ncbi:fatty acid hydroperoxide lyase, chloroplastic-like [Neltuma alba]|uniref:fatty acid hydroperoxide lyase, chloroplastic-like n=1 Tax=Neltuma alba TaxID=207710 RepID=UPI0010A45758|nr:fatty acid hydroperoxide lyase, chloroplastic-like [Prosopis alba]XP_028808365.1 fatty acid hydroperoxide lyase, chloroplastic-like [Prosopis alba]